MLAGIPRVIRVLFEVLAEDLLGRIGRIRTRSGRVAETPLFLPVINPVNQIIPASWMRSELKAEAVITNAYIALKRRREEALEKGVHELIGFDGVVMTDSGGYQVLEYGDVETTPEEIALFQEDIETDIAVPLDVPTGLGGREKAEETVEKTLRNLEKTIRALESRGERRCLWTAPIQGGLHLDLLRRCAEREREMGFDLFALGSPTPLMEGYRFDKLFRMIRAARLAIGFGKPLHLFGAGHPMIFPFIIALGVDMFDSASYILYARDDRYMTEGGTIKVDKLDYLPCSCPVCSKLDAEELKSLEGEERVRKIATHNLYVCYMEVKRAKQAIRDGRLMELLEARARSHPSLLQGFVELMRDEELVELMEKHTPLSSRRGLNLYDELSLRRPRVRIARRRLLENVFPGKRIRSAILIPETLRPSTSKVERLMEMFDEVLFYGSPYGLIPYGLRYTYPFSQTNYPRQLIEDKVEEIASLILKQLEISGCGEAVLVKPRSRYLAGLESKLLEELARRGVAVREAGDLKDLLRRG